MMLSIKESKEFLWLLISADTLFAILFILHSYSGLFQENNYSLEKDRGYAEIFQYVKLFWIAAMFFWLFVNKRRIIYSIWSLLFAYLLIDDSFQLHESLGNSVAEYLGYTEFLKIGPGDYGQLTVLIFVGLFFAALVGVAYRFSPNNVKRMCRNLALMLALFTFFAVVVDMFHVLTKKTALCVVMGILEDGGEMLVVSVICWYVFRLVKQENSDRSLELV